MTIINVDMSETDNKFKEIDKKIVRLILKKIIELNW